VYDIMCRVRLFLTILFLVLAAGFGRVGFAGDGDAPSGGPQVTAIRLGFDGKYKVGLWTPVWVTLAGGAETVSGRVVLTAPDGDGVPTRYTTDDTQPVELPAGAEKTVLLYAKFGRVHGRVTVDVKGEDGILASRSFSPGQIPAAVLATEELIVTAGRPLVVETGEQKKIDVIQKAVRPWHRKEHESVVTASVTRADELPDRWHGYEGVDTLVITASEVDPASGKVKLYGELSSDQIRALTRWVELGGRVILCVGSQGEAMLGQGGPLADLAPGQFERVATMRDTTGLEMYTGAPSRLDTAAAGERFALEMSLLKNVRGRVEVFEGAAASDRPVVVRAPHAFGRVIFVAVDLDREPFTQWDGTTRLVAQLLEYLSDVPAEADEGGGSGQTGQLGFKDLAGQQRSALDQFEGVRLIPFSIVAAILVVYIVLIGPVEYFFLQKVLRRMEWTWLTFTLVVVITCAVAWYLATWTKGGTLRVNRIDVVDVDMERSLVRGSMWAHVYSPKTDSYTVRLVPYAPRREVANEADQAADAADPGRPETLLSWHGLPGRSLGGMNTAVRTDLFSESYAIVRRDGTKDKPADGTAILGMPIQTWSSKSVTARWHSRTDVQQQGRLSVDSVGLLHGELENPLPIELDQCVVYFDRWAYLLDTLEPGQRVPVDDRIERRNIERVLLQRTIQDGRDISTPWKQESHNVPRIMDMIMFHEAAGGSGYTNLSNRYQGFMDLSDHLDTGRAILVGRALTPPGELWRDDAPLEDANGKHWTFYRIVFPVEIGDRG